MTAGAASRCCSGAWRPAASHGPRRSMVSRSEVASRFALACHYRVLTDDPKAFVGLPEVKVGLLPGAGGTQRMPRLIGIANSLPFLLEGTQYFRSGSQEARPRARSRAGGRDRRRGEALAADERQAPCSRGIEGLQDSRRRRVGSAAAAAAFLARTALVAKKTLHNYPAPAAILSCVYEGTHPADRQGARNRVASISATLVTGPVARNLIRTMFVNKGNADKLSVRPRRAPGHKSRSSACLAPA